MFKQAGKENKNQKYQPHDGERDILQEIKSIDMVRSKHIHNILSESAKLSIRDFIDEITQKSNHKIELICSVIIDMYSERVQNLGRNIDKIIALKDEVIKFAEEMKGCKKEHILAILQRELPREKIQDFEEDFASIMFFKSIYDKTSTYFSNLINKIYAELSHLLTRLDKRITQIQKEEHEEVQRKKEEQEVKLREEKREKEKVIAFEHVSKMDNLKGETEGLINRKRSLIEQIKEAMRNLSMVEQEVQKAKQ